VSGIGAPRKRRRWIWWVVLAVVAVVVAAILLPKLFSSSNGQVTYTTAKVERTTLRAVVSGSGTLVVAGVTAVQPGITGEVKDLSVKLGDTVTPGQLLFRLVNSDLDAAVTRAEVSYEQAKQKVKQAEISLTQEQNALYSLEHPSSVGTEPPKAVDATAVSLQKQKVTLASMGVKSAKMDRGTAATALDQAQENADKRTVTAPVAGVITALSAQNGQALGSGSSNSQTSGGTGAAEISDMSTLRARVQVNEVDLVNVKLGQKATVQFDALPTGDASGTVSAIAPTGTNTQGVVTYDVDVTLDVIDARLKPGMSCTVEAVTETKENALAVPTSALRIDASTQQKYVQVVTGQTPKRTDVKTGIVVGTTTEIVSGLTEGQTVVSSSASTSSSASGTSGSDRGGPGGGMGAMFGGRD
jgi:RND family efflux transporter MFP subunit